MSVVRQSSRIRCTSLPFVSVSLLFFDREKGKNVRPFPCCSISVTNSSFCCFFFSAFFWWSIIVHRNEIKDTCSRYAVACIALCLWRDRYNMHHAPCCASSLLLNVEMIVTQFWSNSRSSSSSCSHNSTKTAKKRRWNILLACTEGLDKGCEPIKRLCWSGVTTITT